MKPVYEKCYNHIVKINKESLPAMGVAYHNYVRSMNRMILEDDCLNDSRRITKSALNSIDKGYLIAEYSNKHVCLYLEALSEFSKKMDKKSNILKEKLLENQKNFRENSKKLSKRNHELMIELKDGKTPANELLNKIAQLDKVIQSVIEKHIPHYANSIKIYLITKIENEICQEVALYEKKINELDSETLELVRVDYWVDYIPIEILGDKVPFSLAKDSL